MSYQPPPSPASQPNDPYGQPTSQPPAKKSNTLLIVVLILLGLGIGVVQLLPARHFHRDAARRMQCSNHLKQIALGMHDYHDTYQSLPPAFTVDDQGQPLHSWRTLLLPFIEQKSLYDQIDLSKPWDDPANRVIAETVVETYLCPSMVDPSLTPYVAVVDPSGVMRGAETTHFRDITDGTSNTILIAEVDSSRAVPWMSPQDTDLPTFIGFAGDEDGQIMSVEKQAALADASVRSISNSLDADSRRALATRSGGEEAVLP